MEMLSSENEIEILGDGRYRVPPQTAKGKAYTTVVGSEAEYRDAREAARGPSRASTYGRCSCCT